MIADKCEADGTCETLLSMFNKDGRLPVKRRPRLVRPTAARTALAADLDPQKFLDFSMLPVER
jgi:hypothetical protein